MLAHRGILASDRMRIASGPVLAQGLLEYGMLSTLAASIQRAVVTVEDLVLGLDPKIAVGVLAVLMFLMFRRR